MVVPQMRYPKKKWSSPGPVGVSKESDLQKFADDYLAVQCLKYIRIPDGIFRWVQVNCAIGFKMWFNKTFAGMPDNTVFFPVGEYSIALHMELKSAKGQLHGKQKTEAQTLPWKVCRTPEEVMAAIQAAQKEADRLSSLRICPPQ